MWAIMWHNKLLVWLPVYEFYDQSFDCVSQLHHIKLHFHLKPPPPNHFQGLVIFCSYFCIVICNCFGALQQGRRK